MPRVVVAAISFLAAIAAIACARAPHAARSPCTASREAESAVSLLRRLQGDGIVLYPAAVFPDPDGVSIALQQASDARVEPFLLSTAKLRGPRGSRHVLLDGRGPRAVEAFAPRVVQGSLAPLGSGDAPFAVALGRGLGRAQGVGIGDVLQISFPELKDAPPGAEVRVAALLGWPSELETYENEHVLAALPAARALAYGAPGGDEITGLTVYASSAADLDGVEAVLQGQESQGRPFQLWRFEQLNRRFLAEVEAQRRACAGGP